ncbi:MAG: ABC transporter substrate-binding protein [Clostridia bacterium]
MNYAINREPIIEAVQLGYGSLPTKAKVPFEYSPEKANKLLAEMGLDKRDSEGFRLGPDGKRFVIPFEIAIWTVGSDKVTELVAQYWRDVGIYTNHEGD